MSKIAPNLAAYIDSRLGKWEVEAEQLRALLAVARAAKRVIVMDYEAPRFAIPNGLVGRLNAVDRALARLEKVSK
jgi:hypothetical protein